LASGAKGEGVCILQQALIDIGQPMPRSTHSGNSLPDGIFGVETDRVVRQFQRDNGLKADGMVGRLTLQKLEQALVAVSRSEERHTQIAMLLSQPVG
jgi:peptidoglycan hydrolase-like protein with peptidoglycan-binding domain